MKTVQIPLFLSERSAIADNQVKYGDIEVEPTAAQLESLSPEEKETLSWLVEHGWGIRLIVDSLDWSSIRKSLATRTQERAEEAREKKERELQVAALTEAMVENALAQPDSVWDSMYPTQPRLETKNIPFDVVDEARLRSSRHPDVQARWKAASDRIEIQRKQENEERLRLQAAEEKAKEEKAKRWDEDLRAFAEGIDEFARAATEGYPIERQVLRHILTKIAGRFDHQVVEYDVFKEKMKPYTRPAPDKLAFGTFDLVKANLREAKAPQGVELDILPIQRIKTEDGLSVTAVVVELSHPGKTPDLVLVVPAEPAE